jgi:hypothetical protein
LKQTEQHDRQNDSDRHADIQNAPVAPGFCLFSDIGVHFSPQRTKPLLA